MRIDATWFELDALDVEEILTAPSCVPLPIVPRGVVGVLRWRERAIAVIDVARGHAPLAPGAMRARVVVLQTSRDGAGQTVAVPVSAVREVREAEAADPPMVDLQLLLSAIAGSQPADVDEPPAPGHANVVAIAGAAADYAILVDAVRAIVSPREWTGAAPLHLASIVGAPAAGAKAPQDRILLVSTSDRELAVCVSGAVSFRELDPSELLPLPPLLRGGIVDRVALPDDGPPLLLLDPAAFARSAPTRPASSTT